MIVPSQIKKMPKVERARERLEKAINKLASAVEGQQASISSSSIPDAALIQKVKDLESENASLYKSNKLVSQRLEAAISQLEFLVRD